MRGAAYGRGGRGDGKDQVMFMGLFIVLLVAWLLGRGAFPAGGLIHLLPILAVMSLVVHLVRGRGATI